MLLRDYLLSLNNLINDNPEALDYPVYFASDSEGNNITSNGFGPSVQYTDALSYQVDIQNEQDEEFDKPIIVLN